MFNLNFETVSTLGKGSFGTVVLARRKADGQLYAVKRITNHQCMEQCVNEVRVLASIKSPAVIGYRQAIFDSEQNALHIVMEYAQDGDLGRLLARKEPIPEDQIWRAARQLVGGLQDLARLRVLHRDIKPANIFLNAGSYKLGDFNVSKVMEDGILASTQTGSPFYTAPELWAGRDYDAKVDVWSLGCVLHEMATLQPPFQGSNFAQLHASITKGKPPKIKGYSKRLQDLIIKMLTRRPQNRPSADQLFPRSRLSPGLDTELISVIRVPKNLNRIKQELPGDNYGSVLNHTSLQALPPISTVPHARLPRKVSELGSIGKKNGCLSTQRMSRVGRAEQSVPILKGNRYSAKGGYLVSRQKSFTRIDKGRA